MSEIPSGRALIVKSPFSFTCPIRLEGSLIDWEEAGKTEDSTEGFESWEEVLDVRAEQSFSFTSSLTCPLQFSMSSSLTAGREVSRDLFLQ